MELRRAGRRWYDQGEPKLCFVERKTHRESWKGEESVKERFMLPEDRMVPYLEGEYTIEQAQADLRAKARRHRPRAPRPERRPLYAHKLAPPSMRGSPERAPGGRIGRRPTRRMPGPSEGARAAAARGRAAEGGGRRRARAAGAEEPRPCRRCLSGARRGAQGKTDAEVAKFSKLFTEVQQQIDSKQLRPMIRTQYLRTAFQARPGAPAALTRSPPPPPPSPRLRRPAAPRQCAPGSHAPVSSALAACSCMHRESCVGAVASRRHPPRWRRTGARG